ncbi:hypothetical protein E2C01_070053 [Portunus trituberculatus]|uniref:Uncharacterized protein n=1 Tax=Portunus trituberculatus TaxID=210409 RepID=A0A5B7HT73_PORTR|nr:hypothetical protein [Portunus trituberculatus]
MKRRELNLRQFETKKVERKDGTKELWLIARVGLLEEDRKRCSASIYQRRRHRWTPIQQHKSFDIGKY